MKPTSYSADAAGVERAAISLWNKFAPTSHLGWEDETYKEEYRLAAKDALAAALPPAAKSGWQPIETAPKDGREIVVCEAGTYNVEFVRYNGGEWLDRGSEQFTNATHWRHMLTPPAATPRSAESQ